jgi:hypothetical protein
MPLFVRNSLIENAESRTWTRKMLLPKSWLATNNSPLPSRKVRARESEQLEFRAEIEDRESRIQQATLTSSCDE